MQMKSVMIKEDQQEWLDKNAINFSAFVRNKIDEAMEE